MIWLLLILLTTAEGQLESYHFKGRHIIRICPDNSYITVDFAFPKDPPNQYTLKIRREIKPQSRMILIFDSETSLKLIKPKNAQISMFPGLSLRSNQFIVTFTEQTSFLDLQVFGSAPGNNKPYVLSIILNDVELCTRPTVGYFDDDVFDEGYFEDDDDLVSKKKESFIDKSCGRRKVVHTELIVRGQPTQPGDWPWHVAIIRVDGLSLSYICGGTLLSKTLVLTAAHCASINGNPVAPNSLSIVLGKYNLIGGDIGRQERTVFEVIVHPEFNAKTLKNDIALLKLKSEAVFTDYVQPACLWTSMPTDEVFGTVAGWGFNHLDNLSPTLQQITIPIVSELTCLKSDPIFFHRNLNVNKFCAGFSNGTSVCNGDSGGGFMIFVPDTAGDTDKASGTWYVRGIVSFAARRSDAAVCDPYKYSIFTDVEKYRDWVMENK